MLWNDEEWCGTISSRLVRIEGRHTKNQQYLCHSLCVTFEGGQQISAEANQNDWRGEPFSYAGTSSSENMKTFGGLKFTCGRCLGIEHQQSHQQRQWDHRHKLTSKSMVDAIKRECRVNPWLFLLISLILTIVGTALRVKASLSPSRTASPHDVPPRYSCGNTLPKEPLPNDEAPLCLSVQVSGRTIEIGTQLLWRTQRWWRHRPLNGATKTIINTKTRIHLYIYTGRRAPSAVQLGDYVGNPKTANLGINFPPRSPTRQYLREKMGRQPPLQWAPPSDRIRLTYLWNRTGCPVVAMGFRSMDWGRFRHRHFMWIHGYQCDEGLLSCTQPWHFYRRQRWTGALDGSIPCRCCHVGYFHTF